MSSQIAILIDAENISHKDLHRVLEEVPRHGQIVLQAVYGDWQNPALQKWHELADENNLTIRHQANPSKTKNSSDMKLVVDAMEVLFRTSVDVFCLVTNDADYVPLCDKLHESGKQVIGLGYQHASEAFIRACDKFIFIGRGESPFESLVPLALEVPLTIPNPSKPPEAAKATKPPKPSKPPEAAKAVNPPAIRKLLTKAFAQASQDVNSWVDFPALGQALRKVQPGFQYSTYGHANLSKLLETMPDFVELQTNGTSKSARLKK